MVKVAKGLAWGALAFAVGCHLWAANRGLEMTDEASYLLIALDPWKTWGHGTFHGFLLRPFYLLAGESVVGLRWIGYATLLLGAWRLAEAMRLHLGSEKQALAGLCAPVLMVASFTCYSAGMRTPCYNWMILLGAILAWSGWLRCGRSGLGPVEFGVGLAVALMGKWGAALILLLLFALLSLFRSEKSPGASRPDWAKALLVFAATTAGFAVYAGSGGIKDTLQAGVLIAQTTGSHGWFIVPKYGWELFYYLYRMGRAFVWLLPAIFLFWWFAKKNPEKWSAQKTATFLFAGGLLLAAVRGWWQGGIEQFGKESVLAGCWLLGVAWTVWAVGRRADTGGRKSVVGGRMPEDRGRRAEGGSRKSVVGGQWSVVSGRWPVLWGLMLTPFLCGIGTNTSIADYAGQGTVFMAAAGALMFGRLPWSSVGVVASVALTGLCLIQASRVTSSLLGMYRVGSVLDQSEMLTVGPEAGQLRVDRNTYTEVKSIHEILAANGFRSGNPVVGVDSLCGWVYLSGGSSPGVPWFFRDQSKYLKEVLARVEPDILDTSWVWIRSSSQINDPAPWWPAKPHPARGWKPTGQVGLLTDRGAEALIIYSPKTER